MPSTIQTGSVLENRIVAYTAGSRSQVLLKYTNMSYTVTPRMIGRQQLHKVYRFTFRFIIAGSTSAELRDILTNCERTLNTRGGTLQVSDTSTLFYCGPATSNPVQSGEPSVVSGDNIRTTILTDVELGPKPILFMADTISPLSAVGTWVVEVVAAAEDAYWVGDDLVLGIDSEVSYAINQNHYTRRTVSGRVYICHFTRNGPTFERSQLSQADMEPLRIALLGGLAGQNFMDPVRIPPGFIRKSQVFAVDASENALTFEIVDEEVYQLYPAYITNCGAKMTFSVSGVSAVQYVSHYLTGFVEGPRDVSKTRLFEAVFEIIQDTMPFLTRIVDDRASLVASWSITNDIYDNRLDFSVLAYTPMGAFDVLVSCGVNPHLRSERFFPPGPGGSARIYGSGYRLEDTLNRTDKPFADSEKVDPIIDSISENEEVKDAKDKNALFDKEAKKRLLSFNLYVRHLPNNTTRHALPNLTGSGTSSGTGRPNSAVYKATETDFNFLLAVNYGWISDDGTETAPDFLTTLMTEIEGLADLVVLEKKTVAGKIIQSKLGGRHGRFESFLWKCCITGATRSAILEAGSYLEFTNYMNNNFRSGNFDDFAAALKDYLTYGHAS